MDLPRISNYGRYSSDNYGANSLCVSMPNITVWFSYQTPVAFQAVARQRLVRENDWGPTTGKHLNWIDGGDKESRVSGEEFVEQLTKALRR